MHGVEGFIYPNELELQWSVLIVLYPFITGLVAGAFILASLERVFNVHVVKPTYRLALLTALAFLIVAPLGLLVLFRAFGVRWRTSTIVAIVATLAIWYAFYKLLRVPLPWGVLERFAF